MNAFLSPVIWRPWATIAHRDRLLERGSFLTKYASEIESDPVGDYPRAKACLKELGFDPEEVSNEDYSSLRYI